MLFLQAWEEQMSRWQGQMKEAVTDRGKVALLSQPPQIPEVSNGGATWRPARADHPQA